VIRGRVELYPTPTRSIDVCGDQFVVFTNYVVFRGIQDGIGSLTLPRTHHAPVYRLWCHAGDEAFTSAAFFFLFVHGRCGH